MTGRPGSYGRGILVAALLLTPALGCSASHVSDEQRFVAATRTACAPYLARERALDRTVVRNPDTSIVSSSVTSFEYEIDLMKELRALDPPASSGVSPADWRRAIDVRMRDLAAYARFYRMEFPRLLRSLKQHHPTPKLPPGTGPRAATLAQAFNSAEGRRFIRLERRLDAATRSHERAFERIPNAAGLGPRCR